MELGLKPGHWFLAPAFPVGQGYELGVLLISPYKTDSSPHCLFFPFYCTYLKKRGLAAAFLLLEEEAYAQQRQTRELKAEIKAPFTSLSTCPLSDHRICIPPSEGSGSLQRQSNTQPGGQAHGHRGNFDENICISYKERFILTVAVLR